MLSKFDLTESTATDMRIATQENLPPIQTTAQYLSSTGTTHWWHILPLKTARWSRHLKRSLLEESGPGNDHRSDHSTMKPLWQISKRPMTSRT